MLYNKNFFTRINNVLFLFIYNFFFFKIFFSFFTQHVKFMGIGHNLFSYGLFSISTMD